MTNALEHTGPTPQISLQLTRSGRRLRIAITDSSPSHPSIRPGDATGGFGLRLVEGIAAQWGSTAHPDGGKTVWCELTDAPLPRTAAVPKTAPPESPVRDSMAPIAA